MAPETPKRAAIYARISRDPEGRELGVQRQEEDCRRLAERLNVNVVTVYIDNDVSASTRSKKPRPRFDEMMESAEHGEFHVILAYSNSRLTRRPAEWNRLIDLHERHGVDIHTVASGSADLSRADGRAVARTIAAWDAAEAERVGERVTRAQQQAAQQGRYHGGSRAFGWKDNAADPGEKAIVQEWASRVLSGESLNSIMRDMNDRGVPTVTGVPWRAETIRQSLLNPRMAGWRTRNGEIIAKAVWEPLLDEATWQQVRSVLTDPARDVGIRGRVHLLTSLALCGYCEQPVTLAVSSSGQVRSSRRHQPHAETFQRRRRVKYLCRDCRMYREVSLIDKHVEAYMIELLTHLEDVPDPDTPGGQKVQELRQRIKNNVLAFADSDVMSPGEFETLQSRLKARLAKEEAKLAVPKRQRLVLGMTGPQAAEAWAGASLERKRKIIDAFIVVRLYRGRPGSNSFDPASVELLER